MAKQSRQRETPAGARYINIETTDRTKELRAAAVAAQTSGSLRPQLADFDRECIELGYAVKAGRVQLAEGVAA